MIIITKYNTDSPAHQSINRQIHQSVDINSIKSDLLCQLRDQNDCCVSRVKRLQDVKVKVHREGPSNFLLFLKKKRIQKKKKDRMAVVIDYGIIRHVCISTVVSLLVVFAISANQLALSIRYTAPFGGGVIVNIIHLNQENHTWHIIPDSTDYCDGVWNCSKQICMAYFQTGSDGDQIGLRLIDSPGTGPTCEHFSWDTLWHALYSSVAFRSAVWILGCSGLAWVCFLVSVAHLLVRRVYVIVFFLSFIHIHTHTHTIYMHCWCP